MANNRVILKKSSVASKVPTTGDLEFGELAVNYTDGKIYYKDSSNNIRFFEETNSFQNVDVSGQTTLTADGGSDTLTFVEGNGIGITTDGATNEITIEAVGSSGNDFVDSASFNTTNGELTLTRTDSGTVVADLDGRYLTSETSTLDSVTDRGSSTTNSIGVGSVEVGSETRYDGETTTLSTTTESSVASFSSSSFNGAKLLVQITDNSTGERHISELLITHDGSTAYATEYGVVYTGSDPLASFDVDISSGDVRLLATSASSNSTEYKITQILMVN